MMQMPKTSDKYWIDRAEATIKRVDRQEAEYLRTLKGSYQRASRSIDKDIQAFWNKYQKGSNLTYAQATQKLDTATRKLLQEDALDTANSIVRGNAKLKQDLIDFSKKPQVTRLEGLQSEINTQTASLGNIQNKGMDKTLGGTLQDKYLQERYTIDVGTGIGKTFNMLPESKINSLLKKPLLGANYSERLWGDVKKLADKASQEITQGLIRGDSSQNIARIISKDTGSSYSSAERLVRTEMTNIASESDTLAYDDSGIAEYEYVATLDDRTSEQCETLDGQHFKLSEAQAGVNLPPVHPNCRSTTIAYFGADRKKGMQRRAKGADGESVLVPASTTFSEWKKAAVN